MTDRQSTHGHDCWSWGPKHYECAVRKIERLRKMHQDAYQRGLQAGSRGLREMYDAVQAVKRQDAWGNAQLTEALMEAEERAERAEAEIERLRAEVAAWRELSDHVRVGSCAAIWPDRYTDARTRDVAAALKRAERMEEALALLPDEIVMVEHNPDGAPRMFCCGREVKLSWLHDLQPTHNEECWYARMRAMRDAALAQEDCNG